MRPILTPDSLLRQRFARPAGESDVARVTLGDAALDAALGGGLDRAALHECFAHDPNQSAAATALAALIARRACATGQAVIRVSEDKGDRRGGHLYGAGLAELGVDPTHMFAVHAPDATAALRASADIVKCSGVGAVVLELWGRAPLYDLTASRRLTMAAARSGVVMLVVRIDAAPRASAARTRWSAASAPSRALAANAPGYPAFDVELLRHRGGVADLKARLEWNRDTGCFASLLGGVPAVAVVGTDQPRRAA